MDRQMGRQIDRYTHALDIQLTKLWSILVQNQQDWWFLHAYSEKSEYTASTFKRKIYVFKIHVGLELLVLEISIWLLVLQVIAAWLCESRPRQMTKCSWQIFTKYYFSRMVLCCFIWFLPVFFWLQVQKQPESEVAQVFLFADSCSL